MCKKFCTTVIPSVFFVNGISQIEVGRNLNVSLNFFFLFLVFKETLYAFKLFFFVLHLLLIVLMDTVSVGMSTT